MGLDLVTGPRDDITRVQVTPDDLDHAEEAWNQAVPGPLKDLTSAEPEPDNDEPTPAI